MRIRISAATDVGMARKHNEDCYEVDRDRSLFVVADGMGGHNHGEVASRIAVDTVRDYVQRNGADRPEAEGLSENATLIRDAVRMAHGDVLRAISSDTSLQGMGTTVVGFLLSKDKGALAHVGDSRAYRYREGGLEQLTEDHTWVQEQVVAGYLSEEQAKVHPLKNVVTRALGSEKDVQVDVREIDLEEGDLFLMCSDGLTTMLDDSDIAVHIKKGGSLDEICQSMIREANERGGLDNITVILVAVGSAAAGAGNG